MYGNGPLGRAPAGEFNFEPPAPGKALYLEPTPKRIRVEVGGEVIADSRRAMLLHESGLQPIYYFPPEDVRDEFLEPSDRHTHCPKKGDASYYTIQAGDEVVEAGAWYYPEPLPGAPETLRGRDRVLLRPHGTLVRGGRGDRRAPARPVSPDRRAGLRPRGARCRLTARCWQRANRALGAV